MAVKTDSSILGNKLKVEKTLDSLFQNSAGPSDTLTKPTKATPIVPFEKTSESTKDQETRKRKKIDTTIPDVDDLVAMESLRKKNRPAVLTGEKKTQQKEKNERTVFVGNLPISCMTKQGTKELTKAFSEHGKIESIRFRSFAMANHMDRKGAFITKKFHTNRDEVNGYVVYKEKAQAEAAAAAMDGVVHKEHHLRVDLADASPAGDHKRSVFLGQLPFDVKDEELWSFFNTTGCTVQRVRAVRDAQTNMGKGFGFVQFVDRDSVTIALAMEDKVFREPSHKIRIQRCGKNEGGAPGAKKFSKHTLKKSPAAKKKVDQHGKEKGSKKRTLPTPKLMEGTRSNKEQGNPLKMAKIVRKASKKQPSKK